MKLLFQFAFFLAFSTSVPVFCQQPKTGNQAAEKSQLRPSLSLLHEKKKMLIGILEKQEKDWNQGNLKGFISAYWNSDSLMSVSVKGIQYGWDRMDRNLRRSFPDSAAMGHLDYDVVHIEFIGDNDALVTGKWLRKNEKKFRGGYFSILLRKLQGKWQIVAEHFG
jgi:hypothetical protein